MFSSEYYHLIPLYVNKHPCWLDEWPDKPGILPFVQWPRLTGKQANDWIAGGGLIGLVTGDDMGMYCLDIDAVNGVVPQDTQDWLVENIGWLNTLKIDTSGGGSHYIYEYGGDPLRGRNLRTMGINADFKGLGGFIVLHSPFSQYETHRIDAMPAGLIELVQRTEDSAQESWDGGEIPEGERNDTIARMVWRWVNEGLDYATMRSAAIGMAVTCGLPIAEAVKIVDQAVRKMAELEPDISELPMLGISTQVMRTKPCDPVEPMLGPIPQGVISILAGGAGTGS